MIGNMIVMGFQSGYRANKLHICKLMFYFMFRYNPTAFPGPFPRPWERGCVQPCSQCNVFYYKYLSQLQTGSILKRSAGKKLSEPGRYKVHSHNFFIRKFWILSILNTHRSCRNVWIKYLKKSMFGVVDMFTIV